MNIDETITMTRKDLADRMKLALDMLSTYIFDWSPNAYAFKDGIARAKNVNEYTEKYYKFITYDVDAHIECIEIIMADDELYELFKDGDAYLHGNGHYFFMIGNGDYEEFSIKDKSLLVALKRYLGWSGVEAWAYRKDNELPKSYHKINKEAFDKAVLIVDYILANIEYSKTDDIELEDKLMDTMDELWYCVADYVDTVVNIMNYLKQQGIL